MRWLRSRQRHVGRVTRLAVAIVIVLWISTLVSSDAPGLVATAFWVVVGGALVLWLRRDSRKQVEGAFDMTSSLESALRRNEVEAFDVTAERYAEFEEVEDEGACYAFDFGDGRTVFLAGQEFCPAARFPSLDFSVIYPVDESGGAADMWIEKRGAAAPPQRVIPAEVKRELADRIPEPLTVVRGSVDRVEEVLRRGEQ